MLIRKICPGEAGPKNMAKFCDLQRLAFSAAVARRREQHERPKSLRSGCDLRMARRSFLAFANIGGDNFTNAKKERHNNKGAPWGRLRKHKKEKKRFKKHEKERPARARPTTTIIIY